MELSRRDIGLLLLAAGAGSVGAVAFSPQRLFSPAPAAQLSSVEMEVIEEAVPPMPTHTRGAMVPGYTYPPPPDGGDLFLGDVIGGSLVRMIGIHASQRRVVETLEQAQEPRDLLPIEEIKNHMIDELVARQAWLGTVSTRWRGRYPSAVWKLTEIADAIGDAQLLDRVAWSRGVVQAVFWNGGGGRVGLRDEQFALDFEKQIERDIESIIKLMVAVAPPARVNEWRPPQMPLLYVDGVRVQPSRCMYAESACAVIPSPSIPDEDDIESIRVIPSDEAVQLYGEDGSRGAILYRTKSER